MTGLGTIINAAGIILGGVIGLLFGARLPKRIADILKNAIGLCVIFIGAAGAIEKMLTVTGSSLSSASSVSFMIVISLCLGGVVGELIGIEKYTEHFGEWLKKKSRSNGDNRFVDGFVTASITVCVGAMAIIGSIEDGINGDYSLLLTKAILDCIIIMIMSASYGKGCIFSVIPVVVLQGLVTVLARFIKPVLTNQALCNLTLVGSMLIFCIGINLLFDKKIKVANILPSLIFAVAYAFLPF